jgi:uncharacterized membrane protein YfhO
VTDAYSNGWHAHSLLPTSAATQRDYQVLPADYCLRAIPLTSGHHLLLLSYRPAAFVVGKWISIASLCVYLAALITWCLRRRRAPDASARPAQSVSP